MTIQPVVIILSQYALKTMNVFFGTIDDRTMILSETGIITEKLWQEIPAHFPFVKMDKFIIMPNHIHGIIIIDNNDYLVGNRHACSSNEKRRYQKIPVIIGLFKSSVTRKINQVQNNCLFQWQKSYYDHIIRNENSLNDIRNYIMNNPLNWNTDKENPAGKAN